MRRESDPAILSAEEDFMFHDNRLWPHPQKITQGASFARPSGFSIVSDTPRVRPSDEILGDLERFTGLVFRTDGNGTENLLPVRVEEDPQLSTAGAYRLDLSAEKGTISANDAAGASYALITLAQLIALAPEDEDKGSAKIAYEVEVEDWPLYRKRCFMADLGRSVFSIPLLQRLIRILAQLKMNQLHLHLYDDELCGIRFPELPFGSENPYAMEFEDFEKLIAYAAAYHIEIVPELEGWGHVGSLIYHRPELKGGPGMYGGSSFRIGPDSFDLMEKLIDATASVLPDGGTIHLGLDEAQWSLSKKAPAGFSPSDMVGEYWRIVERAAEHYRKQFDLRLWADHAGRPVPEEIQEHLIIEPWNYWIANRAAIDRAIGRYSGEGKMRFMMGAGQSVAQYRGAYHATRYWAHQAAGIPNAEGGNVTFWGANNIDENFISLFAGAYYLWNPSSGTRFSQLEDYESYDRLVTPIMRKWQTLFSDARKDYLLKDRGAMVEMGHWVWGEHHGEAVAPSVTANEEPTEHDYLNEG